MIMKPSFFLVLLTILHTKHNLFACLDDEIDLANNFHSENSQNIELDNDVISSDSGTHILVFGGGYSASGNQVSLESNVKYFHKIMNNLNLNDALKYTLFADGNDSARDLQFFDPKYKVPKINEILAELFGNPKTIYHQYRSNKLTLNGPSSLEMINRWFDRRKNSNQSDQNIIYFTGHGGKGDTKKPHNTTAYLWSNSRLKVSEFVKKLDQLPIEQSTFVIMVQCYSGGFANIIFEDGDPQKKFSNHSRAGFFSTIQSRVAAGCTPDIREENYQEYSTSFWEALSGVSRIGEKVNRPDYNEDGYTSLMEAHSYVCIHSETIDIPIKTSDVLLRKYVGNSPTSSQDNEKNKNFFEKYIPKIFSQDNNSTKLSKRIEGVTKKEFEQYAQPEEKAVLSALLKKLEINGEYPIKEITKLSEKLKKEKGQIEKEKKKHTDNKNKHRDTLRKRLKKIYPELVNPYHPVVSNLFQTAEKQKILDMINRDDLWKNLLNEKKEIQKFESQKFLIEKKEAKVIRTRRCLENIFFTKILLQQGSDDEKKNFRKLQNLERTIPSKSWKN